MTQAAIVTNGTINYLYGAGNTKASLVGTYSSDYILTLWDVPDDVALGYTWDGTNFVPGVTPVGALDPETYAQIVQEAIESANQLISQSVTAESNSRTQADAGLQAQLDSLTRSMPVNEQTGTTYAIIESDRGSLITFSNASPVAVSLAQAGGGITDGWYVWASNAGVGDVTVTPSVSTIGGGASITLGTDETSLIVSDGTNYFSAIVSAGGVSSVNGKTGAVAFDAADRDSTGLNIDASTTHGDSDMTIADTDRLVVTSASFTNPHTWTLPPAGDLNPGQMLVVGDLYGGISSTNTLTIDGDGSETINGATTLVLRSAYQVALLWSDGTSAWTAITLVKDATNASALATGTVPAARGGAGTLTGILKANGAGVVSAATASTDYAPATSGSAILKGNGSGGFSAAAAGTDYAAATSGSAILKGNGSGGFSSAAAGTDYAAATSGSAILKGNGAGGFSSAAAGTDYLAPPSGTSILKANSGGALANAASGTDYAPATSGTGILKGNGSGGFSTATPGTDYATAGWTTVKKVTSESKTSNTTLADDAELLFAMAANTKYAIRIGVIYTASSTGDMDIRHAGPASPTLVGLKTTHVPPGAVSEVFQLDTAYSAADIWLNGGTGTGWMTIEGVVHNGANTGNFSLKWAQSSSHGTATVVLAGSYLEYMAMS